ncbi:hypothetical protein [Aquimarina pacifica]|uniref:hypothetical protein n=1 Tax=Aquimarina pacifica TaxID=1296415 RepID=UPI001268334C|nr:hypothetical protein [Aquimarina pacifica]
MFKIFGIEPSKFELSPDEKKILSEGKPIPIKTSIIDLDELIKNEEINEYEELLVTLFHEATTISKIDHTALHEINLSDLSSYDILTKQSKKEKKEFVLYLLHRTEQQQLNKKSDLE